MENWRLSGMHYHIILTETCNSKCKYCYEKSFKEFDNQLDKKFKFDFSSPADSEVDVKKLREFLSKDQDPVLVFYGGEPLLQIEKIKKIIDNLKDRGIKFRMQTNGKLLNELPAKYMNAIGKILVSLDGDRKRTDYHKGPGTYDLVMKNLETIRQNGFQGEIIARMTISEFPDVYEQVTHLLDAGFTSIHWQLDAGFFKFDFNEETFEKFVKEYNKSISKLINFWVRNMETNNKIRVLKIYPFIGIMQDLLNETKTNLRCGAGQEGYAISTDGKIIACPIMNCITDFEAGDLENNPKDLKKFTIEECENCNEKDLCGGRCLYWRKAKLWPSKGDELICNTIKHLINELKKKLPKIKDLIENKQIKLSDFNYEKYFGPEIIP